MFLHHSVQTIPGDQLSFYPTGTGGSYPGGKAVGSWYWPLTAIKCWGQEWWSNTTTPPYVFIAWWVINYPQVQINLLFITYGNNRQNRRESAGESSGYRGSRILEEAHFTNSPSFSLFVKWKLIFLGPVFILWPSLSFLFGSGLGFNIAPFEFVLFCKTCGL
jgi:hypothetical protein